MKHWKHVSLVVLVVFSATGALRYFEYQAAKAGADPVLSEGSVKQLFLYVPVLIAAFLVSQRGQSHLTF
jgi:hypothetical protein